MGRSPRADEAGGIYHALNRGNAKSSIFFKEQDYAAFDRIVSEALEKFPVHLIAYQWMNNHWHMVLSPDEDGGMGRFLRWITLTHAYPYSALPRSPQNNWLWPRLPRPVQEFSRARRCSLLRCLPICGTQCIDRKLG